MPVYEYLCSECGSDYTLLRSMAERDNPSYCPFCSREGFKVILTAPRTTFMAKNTRIAHEINERSRHEPQTPDQYKAKKHGPGCGCCSGKKARQTGPDGTPAARTAGSRPWMISH